MHAYTKLTEVGGVRAAQIPGLRTIQASCLLGVLVLLVRVRESAVARTVIGYALAQTLRVILLVVSQGEASVGWRSK